MLCDRLRDLHFPSKSSSKEPQNFLSVDADSKSDAVSIVSSNSDADAPPTYFQAVNGHNHASASSSAAAPSAFEATVEFHIQARGITFNSALNCNHPDSIPIFRLQPGSSLPTHSATPEFISIRLSSNSNSCALIRGIDPHQSPINSTVYRWGPGRPPRIRLFAPNTLVSIADAISTDEMECDNEFQVKSRSIISRTQKMVTPFGKFQWRYGDRSERREACDADSLLILEKIEELGEGEAGGKSSKTRVRVAQLVRSDEFRTPGTKRSGAANGGKLMVDMRMWEGEKGGESEKVRAFVVASCICMLKREADRMRDNAMATIV